MLNPSLERDKGTYKYIYTSIHTKIQREREREMDQILNKVGAYWIGQKANKEIDSVGDDFNVCPPLSFFVFYANLTGCL